MDHKVGPATTGGASFGNGPTGMAGEVHMDHQINPKTSVGGRYASEAIAAKAALLSMTKNQAHQLCQSAAKR